MNTQYMNEKYHLENYFVPTANKTGEISKARIKNANLPFLQMMYHGNPGKSLHCLITKNPGFNDIPNFGTGEEKKRFSLDFNHVRQRRHKTARAGDSVDKGHLGDPGGWWRARYLDPEHTGNAYTSYNRQREREQDVIEFMTIMPVTSEVHSYITQDSAKHDLTLQNFSRDTWAWCLQSKKYFEATKKTFNICYYNWITYDWFIDHMSNIDYPGIRDRLNSYDRAKYASEQAESAMRIAKKNSVDKLINF